MKKYIIAAILICTTSNFLFAQHNHKEHYQKASVINNSELPALLSSYYAIKDALVSEDAKAASLSAAAFVEKANRLKPKAIPDSTISSLVRDAGIIAGATDIKKQREVFATLSTNLFALAKKSHLTSDPIYYQYCPMKKAYWLSSSKDIKNPYYGSAMLKCGKVAETIQ